MGRTACTEPQCLYKGDLFTLFHYVCAGSGTRHLRTHYAVQKDHQVVAVE